MDHVINWISLASSLSEFQPTIDRIVNGLVTKINGDLLLRVAGAVGVAVAAIVVVRLLWTMISAVISPVVSLPWKVISGGVRLLWKVIKAIFGGGKGGKTMKAPGRNYRMFRKDFELNPANYFRNLRK
ncbi:hypothetical protein GmHk_10G027417 [Glycine max]|nr:hypothetical protein GmHk_10G027417 [Glycine max]